MGFKDGTNNVVAEDTATLQQHDIVNLAYQRDPQTGFIAVQENLRTDALNEYIRHNATAMFAVPPGVDEAGYVGEPLFA